VSYSPTDEGNPEDRISRSILAVPGDSDRKIARSLETVADEIFFDLEDAVTASRRGLARETVMEALPEALRRFRRVGVRVNGVRTGQLLKDLDALLNGEVRPSAVILPKARSLDDVNFIETVMDHYELGSGDVKLEVLLETTGGMRYAGEIAESGRRVDTLILGLGDYSAELGIERPTQFGSPCAITDWAAAVLVNSAVCSGVRPIDGPYPSFNDEQGFREACKRAKGIGFEGKWCIHPNQLEWANEEFTPSEAEVREAREIVGAYERAVDEGVGAIQVNGRLVDEATRLHALKILTRTTPENR